MIDLGVYEVPWGAAVRVTGKSPFTLLRPYISIPSEIVQYVGVVQFLIDGVPQLGRLEGLNAQISLTGDRGVPLIWGERGETVRCLTDGVSARTRFRAGDIRRGADIELILRNTASASLTTRCALVGFVP